MRTICGVEELMAAVDEELGTSSWFDVTQERIDAFAAATGDRYWLHVDPVRAAGTELGATIAHGLLTLSLGPTFTWSIVAFEGFDFMLNYGYDKVRFISPVQVGARIRMRLRLEEIDTRERGVRARLVQTFEREDSGIVCVAEQIMFLVP